MNFNEVIVKGGRIQKCTKVAGEIIIVIDVRSFIFIARFGRTAGT